MNIEEVISNSTRNQESLENKLWDCIRFKVELNVRVRVDDIIAYKVHQLFDFTENSIKPTVSQLVTRYEYYKGNI